MQEFGPWQRWARRDSRSDEKEERQSKHDVKVSQAIDLNREEAMDRLQSEGR